MSFQDSFARLRSAGSAGTTSSAYVSANEDVQEQESRAQRNFPDQQQEPERSGSRSVNQLFSGSNREARQPLGNNMMRNLTQGLQQKLKEDNPDMDFPFARPTASDRKIHDKIMDSIIKKYNPTKKERIERVEKEIRSRWNRSSPNEELQDSAHEVGLERMSKDLLALSNGRFEDLADIKAPQKRLYVMIIGNHSAGKSSFINWYVGQRVQQTRISIETIEINLIMHGNKSSELKGYNSMQLLPFMKELKNKQTKQETFPGLLNNLSIKTSPSKERHFENIVFIDTPGLADGNLKYKFDVENVYKWFARHCDLILVFLDPMGQALCQKTNKLVNELINLNVAEVKFYMTKGDVFRSEQDRAKCMCQITQGLSQSIDAAHGFEMPMIYIPSEEVIGMRRNDSQYLPENQISSLVNLLESKLNVKVQNNLARFKQDINCLRKKIAYLVLEQEKLTKTPVQQMLNACHHAIQVVFVILVMTLVNIITVGVVEEFRESKSNIIVRVVVTIVTANNFICERLMIQAFNSAIFFLCLIGIPGLFYAIQWINMNCKVYSRGDMDLLSKYSYQLKRMKSKYEQLTEDLNNAALATEEQVEKFAKGLPRAHNASIKMNMNMSNF